MHYWSLLCKLELKQYNLITKNICHCFRLNCFNWCVNILQRSVNFVFYETMLMKISAFELRLFWISHFLCIALAVDQYFENVKALWPPVEEMGASFMLDYFVWFSVCVSTRHLVAWYSLVSNSELNVYAFVEICRSYIIMCMRWWWSNENMLPQSVSVVLSVVC